MNFIKTLSRIINTGQSRSIILTGNVYDLFLCKNDHVPLLNYLVEAYNIDPAEEKSGIIVVTYTMNSEIKMFGHSESVATFQSNWQRFKGNSALSDLFNQANGNPTFAMEVMRQMSICSRTYDCPCDLLFVIEGADMMVPEEEISRMNVADRRRTAILHDWFSDPLFMDGRDSVILVAESQCQIHSRISKLPQVIGVKIPYPDYEDRRSYLIKQDFKDMILDYNIIGKTAGLSIHALRQLVRSKDLSDKNIFKRVESHIIGQLGEGVVEFKVPTHTFDDVVGFENVKEFMRTELIPAFQSSDKETTISGAAISGPIGGGKTFICEALASELGMPVLVLKNLRSMYYGQTDVIFERLHRALTALDKVVIFVDEADTVFGGVESGHETERRLTGKVQAMMSDRALLGKVLWLLMTARIHLLSPDIRRPGRVGDLIIPILDPAEGIWNNLSNGCSGI
jgi:hypothetical protein